MKNFAKSLHYLHHPNADLASLFESYSEKRSIFFESFLAPVARGEWDSPLTNYYKLRLFTYVIEINKIEI